MSKRLMISDLYIRNVSEFSNQWDYTGSHENKHKQEIFSNAMGKPTVIADSATSHSSIAFDLYSVFYRKPYVFSLIYMYMYIYTCFIVVGLFCGAKTIIIDLFPSYFYVQIITEMVLTLKM